jgi:glycosyltransferase involved in cell wall biosynthesis
MNASPARIAIVAPYFTGGISSVIGFLLRVLRESGRMHAEVFSLASSSRDAASVRLLSPSSWRRGVRSEWIEWEGGRARHFGAFLAELEFQRYRPRRALTRLLDGFDLVQVVAGTPSWALVTRQVARPVILQVATLAADERRAHLARERGPSAWWRAAMSRVTSRTDFKALRFVDTVFVENISMLEALRARMPPSRVVFAPPGVDTDLFRPDPGPQNGGPILCVGRLSDPRKNVRLLFQAYHHLRQIHEGPPPLVLAGHDGPSADDWSVAESLGIRGQIEFREGLSQDELAGLYRTASVFVSSSDEEGLGLAIVEAMASGLPVVSTDSGGPRTSVVHGETGFLVRRSDARELAVRIDQVLSNPELRRRLATRGRERAVSRFSYAAAAEPFLARYDALLRRPTPD